MATKKKVETKAKRTGKASMEFSFDEKGMLKTTLKWGKTVDERLQNAAATASNLFLREAQRAGGVLVNINGQLIVADPVKAQVVTQKQISNW